MSALVDARNKFRPEGLQYKVQIEVPITAAFIWAVLKCIWHRKDLRITHIFTNDPLMNSDFQIKD